MFKFDSEAFIKEMESLEGVEETPLDYEEFEQEEYEKMNERDLRGGINMCEGYWETCTCEDCKKVKELYEALEFYWDNKEEREGIERTIESMGYSV